MKKFVLVLFFVLIFSMSALAASATDNLIEKYNEKDSQLIVALDATCLVSSMEVNGFNFPVKMLGMSPSIGLDYRKFTNIPDEDEILEICKQVLKSKPGISQEELLEAVYKKAHPGNFKYFQAGTELLFVPKIGAGILIPFDRDIKNSGYIDLGICFPYIVNFGLLVSF